MNTEHAFSGAENPLRAVESGDRNARFDGCFLRLRYAAGAPVTFYQPGSTGSHPPPPKYRTIVADPPWDHSEHTGVSFGERANDGNERGPMRETRPPYQHLSVSEITALPVARLAESEAHLYLWTTNRYLRDAYDVAEAWGFAVVKPLVWCKAPMGFMGAPYTSSVEFCLFCRRGSLSALANAGRQWWEWPRARAAHSNKPEAFLDLVEQVSPGPYLELFARRQRLGWDTWGNEALEHVQVSS